MKYIITENQLAKVVSKLTKTPENQSFWAKVGNFFGGDDEAVGRVILKAVKDGKAVIKNFEERRDWPIVQIFNFTVNDLPIKIDRYENILKRGNAYSYHMKIRVFGDENLQISTWLQNSIFEALMDQYEKQTKK